MRYSIQQILVFLAFLPVLLPLIVGLVRLKKLQQPLSYLVLLVSIDFITEIVTHIFWLQKTSNLFLWPFYISLEFGLIAWMYRYELRPLFIGRALPIIIIAFTGFIFITSLRTNSAGFNPIQRFIESVLVILLALAFFYKTLKNLATTHLERQPMFWLSAGLVIYFAGDIFIFIFSNYILSYSKDLNMQVWAIHAILNIFLYIFYTLALCMNPKK